MKEDFRRIFALTVLKSHLGVIKLDTQLWKNLWAGINFHHRTRLLQLGATYLNNTKRNCIQQIQRQLQPCQSPRVLFSFAFDTIQSRLQMSWHFVCEDRGFPANLKRTSGDRFLHAFSIWLKITFINHKHVWVDWNCNSEREKTEEVSKQLQCIGTRLIENLQIGLAYKIYNWQDIWRWCCCAFDLFRRNKQLPFIMVCFMLLFSYFFVISAALRYIFILLYRS